MNEFDVVVIGAGAAGLSAARRIATAPLSLHVLEARDRAGGRGWTLRDAAGLPIELGCGWLHSADENEWCDVAATLGYALDRTRPQWRTQWKNLGFPQADHDDFRAALERFWDRLDAGGDAKTDQAGSRFLDPGCRWNGLIDAISTYMNGVELDGLSARDFWRYRDTGINWRVVEGYGTLIAALAEGLDISFGCPAEVIDHGGRRIRIVTPRGDIAVRAVILTVPTDVLAAGVPRFAPELPDKIAAANALPLGIADKVYLRLTGREDIPNDAHLYGAVDRVRTGSYQLRPLGRPLVEGYFGGELARELEQAGEAGFASFAIDQLAALIGNDIRKRLELVAASAWVRDPWARGSYSRARPGHADARQVLAAAVDQRLFFAGEACSREDFSTAHGAYRTGVAAAEQAISALSG
ncbi:MAG: FAD-dependent oxidoreductase [Xanthobacteraceae bacterium]|nr:FAD-dependent oxidoreductase [Xanthobacteraceae bacterium]